jgi:hypothetical protein
MLAERNRLCDLAKQKVKAGNEVEMTLPEEVRRCHVSITVAPELVNGNYYCEADLLRRLEPSRRLYVLFNKIEYECSERTPEFLQELSDEFDCEYTDKALAKFRAGKEKIAAAREASGCEALFREAAALGARAEEIENQIVRMVATSFAGVLTQLEVLREDCEWRTLLDTIITGVKRLAGGAAGSHG